MPDQTYLATLQLYYEEEIEGDAYFAQLAEMTEEPHPQTCLRLLAQVERHAAQAVEPLIQKYGLTPKPSADLVRQGRADARETAPSWSELLAEMRRSYDGYLEDFRALEAMGPVEDRPRLAFLTAHEVAAIDFLDRDASGAPDSTAPLLAYLRGSPDTMAAA